MLKTAILSVALVVAGTSFASAQTYHRMHRHSHFKRFARTNGVLANGRCDGISYGTGSRRCGSATGGPSGGGTQKN